MIKMYYTDKRKQRLICFSTGSKRSQLCSTEKVSQENCFRKFKVCLLPIKVLAKIPGKDIVSEKNFIWCTLAHQENSVFFNFQKEA